ncbi:MAG: RnfABCDGE type electron transport complex subunit B [Oscillospiraceae bacterium]|nr:RnfABCDGE type electron transport complex subunit B [Oscillospiraceae bacterium]
MSIAIAVVIVTVTGLLGAAILVVAAQFMHVEEDERVGLVAAELPGANCGACGYAGCADYAKAVVEGAPVNKCVPGGAATAAAVAAVMGVEAGEVAVRKAVVACQGSYVHTTNKYDYEGIKTCAACNTLYNGRAACQYGCLGYGDCAVKCKFGAITISNGVAVIDKEKCTGCGACASACPNNIIWVLPESDKPVVLCANKERGALTRKGCSAGCIGCMKCEKTCQQGAIKVVDNVASIDHEKCTGCRECVEVCPVKAITIPKNIEEAIAATLPKEEPKAAE